ncbi:hypothetical protein EHV15_35840 [Paenibacillus oralis]|uniref:Uncharacterized protein n=1 Tax=Paenibacillus oralis TaxID=2490856 RepID=A0A3P3TA65_9BACL|nr:hypothetical protein [Paenibacillus oralis]RRJ54945.1 hypothetical protein EHV15_35840 [Paenibacillus oralis]
MSSEKGKTAAENTCFDFNWGDAVTMVPEEIWNRHGIFSVQEKQSYTVVGEISEITVNQDEVLYSEMEPESDEVVYRCKNGGEYSKAKFKTEILTWMDKTPLFINMSEEEKSQAMKVVYPFVLHRLTWECPSTLLQDLDEESLAEFMSLILKAGAESMSKDVSFHSLH